MEKLQHMYGCSRLDETQVEFLCQCLRCTDPAIGGFAMAVIEEAGDDKAFCFPAFQSLLADSDPSVRLRALVSMRRISEDHGSLLPRIVEFAFDEDYLISETAMRILASLDKSLYIDVVNTKKRAEPN